MSAAAKGCIGPIYRSATAFTNRLTREKPGRIWDCAMDNRWRRSRSILEIPIDSSLRWPVIPTVLMRSAEFSARSMAARRFEKVLYRDENTGGGDVQIDPANPDDRVRDRFGNRAKGRGKIALGMDQRRHLQINRRRQNMESITQGSSRRKSSRPTSRSRRVRRRRCSPRLGRWSRRTFIDRTMAANPGLAPRMIRGRRPVSAAAICRSCGSIRRILRSFIRPASFVGNRSMAARRGTAGAARRAATITRTFGSIRTIRTSFCSGSDQGAIITVNGGQSWSSWYNQPTAQLYHVSADNAFPYRLYSGQQESGSVGIASRGNRWRDHLSRLASGRGGGIRLCRRRSARSRYHLWRQADALRSPHRPGAGDSSGAIAFARFSNDPHPAGGFFSGRSAFAFLFREHALADARRRAELATDQPGPDAQDLRVAGEYRKISRRSHRGSEAARRDLHRRALAAGCESHLVRNR